MATEALFVWLFIWGSFAYTAWCALRGAVRMIAQTRRRARRASGDVAWARAQARQLSGRDGR